MGKIDINDDINEVLTVSDLVSAANDFINNKIDTNKLDELIDNNMIIRAYIPLLEKTSIIMNIITQHVYSTVETYEIKIAELYKNIFFYVILQGYGGIKVESREDITFENYDLLYPLFTDYILQYCKNDYETIIQMLITSLNIYQTEGLSDTISTISADKLQESTELNKQLIDSLNNNKELVSKLSKIAELNNPELNAILQNIKKDKQNE